MQVLSFSKPLFKTTITTIVGLSIAADGYEDIVLQGSQTLL